MKESLATRAAFILQFNPRMIPERRIERAVPHGLSGDCPAADCDPRVYTPMPFAPATALLPRHEMPGLLGYGFAAHQQPPFQSSSTGMDSGTTPRASSICSTQRSTTSHSYCAIGERVMCSFSSAPQRHDLLDPSRSVKSSRMRVQVASVAMGGFHRATSRTGTGVPPRGSRQFQQRT